MEVVEEVTYLAVTATHSFSHASENAWCFPEWYVTSKG